ncbi:MAG: transposase [Thermoguttaceae bacterium]
MSAPIAFFITFTCYGTWLHGDAKGSVDHNHKIFGQDFAPKNSSRKKYEATTLKHPQVLLTTEQRSVVQKTVIEVCEHRNWKCWELSIQSNHTHLVISGDAKPEKMMADIKAYATRQLRKQFVNLAERTIWTEGGSTRYLWDEASVKRTMEYVRNQ